jgi:hypothetical protein
MYWNGDVHLHILPLRFVVLILDRMLPLSVIHVDTNDWLQCSDVHCNM